ncbi:MAG: cysteine desulfurase [Parcubacteria group bacterium]|nr:cysteine desulfurase [Parcubacteria group bacterium]
MKRIFLDYASTTPVESVVYAAMEPYFSRTWGNPSSLHEEGQRARIACDDARESVARFLSAREQEIIFTSGATEANNLAITGVCVARVSSGGEKLHLLVSAIEHPSVIECAEALQKRGIVECERIAVSAHGKVEPSTLAKMLRHNTVLVSIQYANSEIGVIQDIPTLAQIVARERLRRKADSPSGVPILFHSDAVQAAHFLDCSVERLGVDLLTLSGHKIYGPKGVGVLYVKQGVSIIPMTRGGFQEFGARSGTENVPAIVGMGKAVELIDPTSPWVDEVRSLRDRLTDTIVAEIPGTELNSLRHDVLPHITNISFPHIPGEALLIALDQAGISVALGTACSTRSIKPSHVLLALGYSPERARSSIRMSLGKGTTRDEIDRVIKTFHSVIPSLSAHARVIR